MYFTLVLGLAACAPENVFIPDTDVDTDDTDVVDTDDTDDTDPPVLEEARFYVIDMDYAPAVADDYRVLLYDWRTADVYLWAEQSGLGWVANSSMQYNYAHDISADGNVIVGNFGNYTVENDYTQAATWTPTEGWTRLGKLPSSLDCPTQSSGYAVTNDGRTVFGLAWDGCNAVPMRWTSAGGLESLSVLGNGGNRISATSGDGSLSAGFVQGNSSRSPAVWFGDGTGLVLNMNWSGEFHAVNDAGTLAAGELAGEAFVWNPDSGQRFLGSLRPAPNPSSSAAYAICGENDELVLGWDSSGGGTAFAWTEDTGILPAEEYLRDLGVPVPENIDMTWGFACTRDKRVLTGRVGAEKSWIAIVPAHLYEPAE